MRMQFDLKQLILDWHKQHPQAERLTYERLADRAGVSKTTIYNIANNRTINIDLVLLARLCAVFSCTPNDLIIRDDSNGAA